MGNANLRFPYTEEQRMAIAILRTTFAVPSIVGAGYIIQHITRSPKRRKRVFTRIMLGMSLNDFIVAFVHLCGVLPVPAETGIRFSMGTWPSCEAFGFLLIGSRLSSILYNATLTHYYVLTIRFQWSEWKCKKKVQLWLHLIPLLYGWVPAAVGIPLKVYNPAPFGCAVRPYPHSCRFRDPPDCIRGGLVTKVGLITKVYNAAFLLVPLMVVFLYILGALCIIYRHIATVEGASDKFSPSLSNEFSPDDSLPRACQRGSGTATGRSPPRELPALRKKRMKVKRKFASQALFYCLAFAVTWIFTGINVGIALFENAATLAPVAILNSIFAPLQGFWNAMIYIWPRYKTYREKQRNEIEKQQRQQERQCSSGDGPLGEHTNDALPSRPVKIHHGNRMNALLLAVSVDAEDDEDDYEYIVFGHSEVFGCNEDNNYEDSEAEVPAAQAADPEGDACVVESL